eukprot:gene12356-8483_t
MSADWESIAKAAEDKLAQNDIEGYYKMLDDAYKGGARHPQILWRLAKGCYEMASEFEKSQKDKRNPFLTRGLELAKEAVLEDPSIPQAHKWAGVLLSEQDVSNKEKIANAYVIRDYFLKSIELNPQDPTSFHCMGSWCWSIMQIGWMERTAATVLFGTPPTSSYEDALKYLQESARLGDSIQNCRLLGDVLVAMNKTVESMIWYQKAVTLPVTCKKDQREHDIAEERIKKVNLVY